MQAVDERYSTIHIHITRDSLNWMGTTPHKVEAADLNPSLSPSCADMDMLKKKKKEIKTRSSF
jgi:hypothetical protein